GRKATETEILENSSKNTDGIIQAALHTESSKTVVSRYQVKSGLRILGSDIVKEARKWVNYGQYAFGGVDPTPGRGADCSGFVQYVFKQNGIELPRGAYEQGLTNTIQITDISQIRAGDLQVWSGHIGICTGQGTSIHALNPGMGIQELPMFSVYGSGAFLGFFRRVDVE
ncbi:MAG: C40 family peptidase, partial [Solobacterium sp.]|nr:C40 family peptidase [Solobacterium sp.]